MEAHGHEVEPFSRVQLHRREPLPQGDDWN
jgi:hypothetical protein